MYFLRRKPVLNFGEKNTLWFLEILEGWGGKGDAGTRIVEMAVNKNKNVHVTLLITAGTFLF